LRTKTEVVGTEGNEAMSVDNTAFLKLLDYEQRSLAFEPQEGAGNLRSGEWVGVVFRIGETRLTCNIDHMHEFLPVPHYTPVPGAKPWILGLASVRGDLLTVVDLAWFLTGERTLTTIRTRLLAANLRGQPVGLMVDEVFGQRHFVLRDGKQPRLPAKSPLKPYVSKQYRSGKDTWHELDLDQLFTTVEFLNGAAA
jgi:twitching motility protein PilI